jgi:hypothetical protein
MERRTSNGEPQSWQTKSYDGMEAWEVCGTFDI